MSDPTADDLSHAMVEQWSIVGVVPVVVAGIAWAIVLACFVVLLIVQTRRKRKRGSLMIFIFSAMFLLISFQYAVSLFLFVVVVRDLFLLVLGDDNNATSTDHTFSLDGKEDLIIITASSASWLLMILFGDLVVLWRAWELSAHNSTAKRLLVVPSVVLLSYIGTIPVVLLCQSRTSPTSYGISFSGSCGRKSLVNWCLSLLSNLLSTCVIAYIGWNHRTEMRILFSSGGRRSVAETILGLLSESGFVYFLVNMMVVVTAISTPNTYNVPSHSAPIFLVGVVTPCATVFVPMVTHVAVLLYGSLWDEVAEHSRPPASNRVARSIQFAAASRMSSETSLDSTELSPRGIETVPKEDVVAM